MAVASLIRVNRRGETDSGYRILEFVKSGGVSSGNVMVHNSAHLGDNVWIEAGSPVGVYSSVGDNSVIEKHCHIGQYVQIGKDCTVGYGASIGKVSGTGPKKKDEQPDVAIGDNSHIGVSCKISEKVKIGSNVRLGKACHVSEGVVIGDGAQIGDKYTLEKDVKIPEGARFIHTPVRVKVGKSEVAKYLVKEL